MGRPINPRKIGIGVPEERRILVRAHIGGSEQTAIITRQRSNTRYRVQSLSDPEVSEVCILANTANPGPGEMSVPVQVTELSPVDYARNLNNRTVKTFQGNVYPWPEGVYELGWINSVATPPAPD